MKNRRVLYTALIILLTIITVGIIATMRINEADLDIYDKLDTKIMYGQNKVGDFPLLFEYWNKVVCQFSIVIYKF